YRSSIAMSFQVGQTASISETMTDEKVREFARLTGDTNPLHLDEKFAKQTRFGRRIVHGAMVTGLLSKLAGTKLPGPGAAVLSAQFTFKKPCYVGDTITASIEIKRYRKDK